MAIEGQKAATIRLEVEVDVTKESLQSWGHEVDTPGGRDAVGDEMRDEMEEMWTEWGPTTKLEVTVIPVEDQPDGS